MTPEFLTHKVDASANLVIILGHAECESNFCIVGHRYGRIDLHGHRCRNSIARGGLRAHCSRVQITDAVIVARRWVCGARNSTHLTERLVDKMRFVARHIRSVIWQLSIISGQRGRAGRSRLVGESEHRLLLVAGVRRLFVVLGLLQRHVENDTRQCGEQLIAFIARECSAVRTRVEENVSVAEVIVCRLALCDCFVVEIMPAA